MKSIVHKLAKWRLQRLMPPQVERMRRIGIDDDHIWQLGDLAARRELDGLGRVDRIMSGWADLLERDLATPDEILKHFSVDSDE